MIIYQVLTRLFSKGRFPSFGARQFDYFKSLSVTHIWYTGIVRHSQDRDYVKGDWGSPYSIDDYYDVNPYLADNPERRLDEFRNLVSRTHRAGLKVIIDFVPNHVSPDYSDAHGGLVTMHRCDYDWTDTDKIDYGCRDNWAKLLDIILYWAGMGVDGFRCDMAELVPVEFWTYLIDSAKKVYPELTFIAEVYDKSRYREFICGAHFDLLYDKSGLYDRIRGIYAGNESAEGITSNWQYLSDIQPYMLNFLENHDEQRMASDFFAGKAERGYAALAVSALFYPTAFMLYFGQEIGEDAHDGAQGRTSIFSHVRSINPCGRLDAGQKATLETYRQILAVKTALEHCSNYDLCYCQGEGFDRHTDFAFLRGADTLIVCNFSDESKEIAVRIPSEAHSDFPSTVKEKIGPKNFKILNK